VEKSFIILKSADNKKMSIMKEKNCFIEWHTRHVGLLLKTKAVLEEIVSRYQKIQIIETIEFGKVLAIDDKIQFTERDEFIYHEMIVHPAMSIHPNAQDILVVGGGDGGCVRELLKYAIRSITLCEIDEAVIQACRRHFPNISGKLNSDKVLIEIQNGASFVANNFNRFDLIIIDSTDPMIKRPSKSLYSKSFYKSAYSALKPDGMMVSQTGTPFYKSSYFRDSYNNMKKIFPKIMPYLVFIPTYPSGMWSFILGSKKFSARHIKAHDIKTGYFSVECFRGALFLPKFVEEAIART